MTTITMASRNRHSTAKPTPSRPSVAPADQLPPYRKPSHPLNDRAQANLRTLYDRRTLGLLNKHNKDAQDLITETAGSINDMLREHEAMVVRKRKKWEKGVHLEDQEKEEQEFEELEEKVAEMTKRLEESMRTVIDAGEGAQRIDETLEWLRQNAPRRLQQEYATQMSQRQPQSQRRHRRQRDEDGDEDMEDEDDDEGFSPGPTPLDGARVALTGPSEMFTDHMQSKKDEYTSFSHGARYSKNNAYIGFKKMVHDAKYGDTGQAMPHPDTWFTEHGSPAPGITATQGGDDDEDDIVVDKATISTRCPITFQQFKEPYTSNKCPHTFEKYAILEMIRRSPNILGGTGRGGGGVRAVECPVTGCDQMLSAPDLHADNILIRKIKRMQQAEAREAEESEDEDDAPQNRRQTQQVDSSDAEDTSSALPRTKRESESVVPATQVLDLGDPSDEDDE